LYYVVIQEGGEDTGWGGVVEGEIFFGGEVLEGGGEVALRGAGAGLEGAFGEGVGVEGGFYRGGRGGGEDFGVYRGVLDVVEGEARSVRSGVPLGDGPQVASGYAWLEDQASVGLGDAAAIVEDG